MTSSIEKKYRRSVQREQILSHLQGRYDHPTAMAIYEGLKPSIPSLSLGNLYRNLGILLEQGRIIKVRDAKNDEDRFDGQVHDHFHFYCTSCGTLYDLPAEGHPDLRSSIAALGDWQVTGFSVNLTGHCPACRSAVDKR